MRESCGIRLESIKAVIFDMDGVLIDSMPLHARAWIEILREIGVEIGAEDVYAHEGEPALVSLGYFFAKAGRKADPDLLRDLVDRKERLYKQIANPEVFSGVREFLEELSRRGKRLAIVTGTARHELDATLPVGIRERFEVIVTGDRIRRGKPDPEPYLTALRELNLPPDMALVVENAPLGVLSAKAAGITCLTLATSVSCAQLSASDGCFPDIPALAHYLLAEITC